MFPQYTVDRRLRVRPTNDTPRINFDWLKDLLLSSDLSRDAELDYVANGKVLRFLDGGVAD